MERNCLKQLQEKQIDKEFTNNVIFVHIRLMNNYSIFDDFKTNKIYDEKQTVAIFENENQFSPDYFTLSTVDTNKNSDKSYYKCEQSYRWTRTKNKQYCKSWHEKTNDM